LIDAPPNSHAFSWWPVGAVAVGVVVEREPRLLLALAREREVADRRRVDFFASVKIADAREQIAERENALHALFGNAEGRRNILGRPAFAHQLREGLPARDLVRREPRDILDHRRLDRRCVIGLGEDAAGQRLGLAGLFGDDPRGVVAPRARDDFDMAHPDNWAAPAASG
jgi:hypothetical protein